MRNLETIALPALLLLVACAGPTPESNALLQQWQGVPQSVLPCCQSVDEALGKAKQPMEFREVFNATTQHYDFGMGLAPFKVVRVESRAKVVEVEAQVQRLTFSQGGDGMVRCFGPELIFFGDGGRRLPAKLLDSSQRFNGPDKERSCFYYFEVPASAVFMVVTTDPSKNLERHAGLIKSPPDKPLTSSSEKFFKYPPSHLDGYKSSSYGPLAVRALPNE